MNNNKKGNAPVCPKKFFGLHAHTGAS